MISSLERESDVFFILEAKILNSVSRYSLRAYIFNANPRREFTAGIWMKILPNEIDHVLFVLPARDMSKSCVNILRFIHAIFDNRIDEESLGSSVNCCTPINEKYSIFWTSSRDPESEEGAKAHSYCTICIYRELAKHSSFRNGGTIPAGPLILTNKLAVARPAALRQLPRWLLPFRLRTLFSLSLSDHLNREGRKENKEGHMPATAKLVSIRVRSWLRVCVCIYKSSSNRGE